MKPNKILRKDMVTKMKLIGITGGVGAGKSEILSYIEAHYSCKIIRADEAAHELEEPGEKCYEELIALLGQEILFPDGKIDKLKMAEKIFSNPDLLEKVNQIIHPAVKEYICDKMKEEQQKGEIEYFFLEAALLIEEHYDEILDEMWYIHTDAEIRRQRLKSSRNYSEEKISKIMSKQLTEEMFRKACKVVITNNGNLQETYEQIDSQLSGKKS